MDAASTAVTIFLFGFAGLFLLAAGFQWLQLIRDPKRLDEKRTLSVDRLQSTAVTTAIALSVLAVAVLWFAFITFAALPE